jgi:hypothetical protein
MILMAPQHELICPCRTQSEIVVPVIHEGSQALMAVLDSDSDSPAAFDEVGNKGQQCLHPPIQVHTGGIPCVHQPNCIQLLPPISAIHDTLVTACWPSLLLASSLGHDR